MSDSTPQSISGSQGNTLKGKSKAKSDFYGV